MSDLSQAVNRAYRIFQIFGWTWYGSHRPTREDIRAKFLDLRSHLKPGRSASSGRLHVHRWSSGEYEYAVEVG